MPDGLQLAESLFGREVSGPISVAKRNKAMQYWKKCSGVYNGNPCPIHKYDFGWVTLGPVMSPLTAIEYTEFQASKHMTPLPQYGQYEVGNVPGQDFNVTDQETRFKAIIAKGGIAEFPISQMKAYNWHRFKEIRELFPALQEIVDFPCEHGCIDRVFSNAEIYRTHVKVWHQDVAAPQAIGKEFNRALEALGEKMSGVGNITPELIAVIASSVAQAMKQAESN